MTLKSEYADWILSAVKRPTPEGFDAWQREHSAEVANPGKFVVPDLPTSGLDVCPQCRAVIQSGETCPACGQAR